MHFVLIRVTKTIEIQSNKNVIICIVRLRRPASAMACSKQS